MNMNMNSKRKENKEILDRMVATGNLTSDGKDWLTCALDPFHDFNHQLAGYPDASVSQTVVSCYQYQTTVVAPGAGDWDAHVFTLPIAQASTFHLLNQSADWTYAAEAAVPVAAALSTLNIVTNVSGAALIPVLPASATQARTYLPAIGVEEVASGNSRVIAVGYEVHNTTAEIYKQGAVCSYRMPCTPGLNQLSYGSAPQLPPPAGGPVVGKRFPQPPATQADAMRLKTSRTWDAKDGIYSTVFQSSVDNPLTQMSNSATLFTKDSDPGVATTLWMSEVGITQMPVAVGAYTPLANKTMPYDITGAFFTGLSNQTSLTIKLRVYVERAPGFSLPDLAPLASPSAGYDIKALEMYAQAINSLPAAVKVDENAAGDWWRAVGSVLKHVAGPVLTTGLNAVVPGAGILGSAVQSVLGQLDTRRSISEQVQARLPVERPRLRQAPPQQAQKGGARRRPQQRPQSAK